MGKLEPGPLRPGLFSKMNLTPGEIIDKASILKVKIRELQNGDKLAPQLAECLAAVGEFPQARVMWFFDELTRANQLQWVANERLFEILDSKEPVDMTKDELFAAVSCIMRAHTFNKQRVELKNRINTEFGVGYREEKSFACSL